MVYCVLHQNLRNCSIYSFNRCCIVYCINLRNFTIYCFNRWCIVYCINLRNFTIYSFNRWCIVYCIKTYGTVLYIPLIDGVLCIAWTHGTVLYINPANWIYLDVRLLSQGSKPSIVLLKSMSFLVEPFDNGVERSIEKSKNSFSIEIQYSSLAWEPKYVWFLESTYLTKNTFKPSQEHSRGSI